MIHSDFFNSIHLFLQLTVSIFCVCNFGSTDGIFFLSWNSHKQIPAAAAKSLQSCLTLCDPIDGSPPGSAVPGILQARTLEWVAIFFSNS